MSLMWSIVMVAGLVLIGLRCWERAAPGGKGRSARREVLSWALKGLVFPAIVWMLLNAGLSPRFPPLVPEVAEAWAAGGTWFREWAWASAAGLWLIGTWWLALTGGWLLLMLPERVGDEDERAVFKGVLLLHSLALGPLALLVVMVLGWTQLGLAAALWFVPLAWSASGMFAVAELPPDYSHAVTQLNLGRTNQAELAIVEALERHQDDYDGWMMLAELYATQYHDLGVADQTVREVCAQPNVSPSQLSVALHRLADWHLKVGQDPLAARLALEEISRRLPGTHLDVMARHRVRQLPPSREALLRQLQGRSVRLPALAASLDQPAGPERPLLTREAAVAKANQCVNRLRANPDDTAAREELAWTFAEGLDQMDQALEQMRLLLGMRGQPPEKMAAWLALLASWQLRNRRDEEGGRQTLARLIDESPQSPQAFAAQRRLNLMDMERKLRQSRARAAAPSIRVVPRLPQAARPRPEGAWPAGERE